ncbi:MAG: calcium/sodium antiporter [Bacilli bacterium]|nr:calcium/sodium antiporter [Bacilli bacterium]
MLDLLLEALKFDTCPAWLANIVFVVALALGVFLLVKCCDIMVDNSSALAKRLGIPALVVGLTIVAIGTSCPELAVSVSDSISVLRNGGYANTAVGNVVGSNICNILLVLGFSSVFTPIIIKKNIIKKEYPILLGITGILVLFGLVWGTSTGDYAILRWEAIILVCLIPCYIAYLVINAKRHPEEAPSEDEEETLSEVKEKKAKPVWLLIILAIAGALGVALGGDCVVVGAKGIANSIATVAGWDPNLSQTLIAMTIVAVGTSLPELVTSTIAAKRGENDLALGNVIGSNIFNTIFVLGISGTITPLTANGTLLVDVLVMAGVTILVYIFALWKGKVTKWMGGTMLGLYFLFLVFMILRTTGIIAM